jgi:hypothetical protein
MVGSIVMGSGRSIGIVVGADTVLVEPLGAALRRGTLLRPLLQFSDFPRFARTTTVGHLGRDA